MKLILQLLMMGFMVACLPEAPQTNSTGSLNEQSGSVSTEIDDDNSELTPFQNEINWLDQNLTSTQITVTVQNRRSVLLVGDEVHAFLTQDDNFNATYCMQVNFQTNTSPIPNRFRVRLTPTFSNSTVPGEVIRSFQVNLDSQVGNDICNKSTIETIGGSSVVVLANDSSYVDSISSSYFSSVDGDDIPNVYDLDDICPSCSRAISSESAILYKLNSSNNLLERVDTTQVAYNNLFLRVSYSGDSNSVGNCSNTTCQNSGFDCCIDGQCVNDQGVILSGVQANPSGFMSAEREKFSNPVWYRRYPEFYYICTETPIEEPSDPSDNEPEDPIGDAEDRLIAQTADFECLEELRANTQADPFHRNPINSSATYSKCLITDAESGETLHFENVLRRLYETCACSDQSSLAQSILVCPAYIYNPVFQQDSLGNQTETIAAFTCGTIPSAQTPLPFEDLNVEVSSRTAPHRFFNVDGDEIDPIVGAEAGASTVIEGKEFRYLDDGFIFPRNDTFNMNSILGQMTVDLSGAQPARLINLEFNKQYLISTKSGSHIPCPGCANDPWNSSFSANPATDQGVGLRSIGFTTRRDLFGSNSTGGSYADTAFGRACWVPPTMLPFSHDEKTTQQAQRLARLETQSAMYVNGYQKDWYGFNKGALIGSFDGVTWFAVGKNRIVTASSDKLYLAINAPFSDLAASNTHIVAVQEYDFTSTGSLFDYNPELELNDAAQNEAASCQENHECETDAHCITKLGWEYTCADVSLTQTKWPEFNVVGADEEVANSRVGSIASFLQQGALPPGGSSRRCVYRGAGAPCRVDAHNIESEALRENLTCAPNFYCAAVDTPNVFNTEVARFGTVLERIVESKNHLFGLDANILGRPKHYIDSSTLTSLPLAVQQSLRENIQLMDTSAVNVGLCRPGKKLPAYASTTDTRDWEQSVQHEAADPLKRTDYISQIAGCNSALYTDLRYSSCPILDNEGNYINTQESFLNDNFIDSQTGLTFSKENATAIYSFSQNACGLESLSADASPSISTTSEFLANFSAFRTIEGRSLASSTTITGQTLVRDACLRKAGAVCHTDLDCSPNRLMVDAVNNMPASFFGNEAERQYYREPLSCTQATREPRVGEDNFNTYTLHNNRCCRPVGSELTMFTEDSSDLTASASQNLRSDIFGSLDPTNPNRYSRYSVVEASIDRSTGQSLLTRPSANTQDLNNDKILDNTVNITNTNQWRTLHETAARTCCGGTWVRQFRGGGHDWSNSRSRLSLNPSNFSCINFRSPLARTENPSAFGLTEGNLGRDRLNFCTDPTQNLGGCIEVPSGDIDDFSIIRPTLNLVNATMLIDSDSDVMATLWPSNPWAFHKLIPSDEVTTDVNGSNLVMDWTVADRSEATRTNISTIIPSFIAFNSISEITIELENPDGTSFGTCAEVVPSSYSCPADRFGICSASDPWNAAGDAACNATGASCCYMYNSGTRALTVSHPNSTQLNSAANFGSNGNILSARLSFAAPGTLLWEQIRAGAVTVDDESVSDHRRSSTPGNALYYLKRLSKLEYLGIPQMTYEPIYCNDNYQNLVPGIFDDSSFGQALQTAADFLNHDRTFIDPTADQPWNFDSAPAPHNANGLNQSLVANSELINSQLRNRAPFSDNKFQCCLELGSQTDDASQCCSGTAVDEDGNTTSPTGELSLTCKLPNETDLNVYFNKFVSGEGLREFDINEPLELDDFDPKTGEPLTTTSVLTKLTALGEFFCESGTVRRGGVFGNFQAKPFGPLREPTTGVSGDTQFTIVDETGDLGSINNRLTGRQIFDLGYRWNHHVYCDGLEEN